MNFYLNAITVTEKDGEIKVLQEPRIIFAGSQKEVEYMSLKSIPKKYAKKLNNVHIYVQQLFNYGNYSGYGSSTTYTPTIWRTLRGDVSSLAVTNGTGNSTFTSSNTLGSGSVINASSINGDDQ